MPVDLHRTGDVAGVVEKDILIGFDYDEAGSAEVLLQPVGADEPLGVCIVGEGWGRIGLDGHELPPAGALLARKQS